MSSRSLDELKGLGPLGEENLPQTLGTWDAGPVGVVGPLRDPPSARLSFLGRMTMETARRPSQQVATGG